MRVSIDKDDRSYDPSRNTNDIVVLLDGVKQTMCITADDEEGYIIRYATDANGKILIDNSGEHATTECVHGVVTICDWSGLLVTVPPKYAEPMTAKRFRELYECDFTNLSPSNTDIKCAREMLDDMPVPDIARKQWLYGTWLDKDGKPLKD